MDPISGIDDIQCQVLPRTLAEDPQKSAGVERLSESAVVISVCAVLGRGSLAPRLREQYVKVGSVQTTAITFSGRNVERRHQL